MKVKISPHIDKDVVVAPASKSYAQRAILAAALSSETSIIRSFGSSADVEHIIEVARQMGASVDLIDIHPKTLQIKGHVNQPQLKWQVGESGLGARLAIPIAAAITETCTITGEGSLLERPMTVHEKALPQFGVEIRTNNGKLPVQVSGKLTGAKVRLNGADSSQYFSGLLMALPFISADSELIIDQLASRPYLNMTLALLADFGIDIEVHDNTYTIKGDQSFCGVNYTVEGDWSGAAFWLVYGALYKTITIHGLNENSLQADRAILEVLDLTGAPYRWEKERLIISPSQLNPFDFDAWHCPDLFPALVVLAAGITGVSKIHGVERLIHKESNRGIVLQKEFAKLGLELELNGNTMIVNGTGKLRSGTIHSHNDHRIAMAGAIAALLTNEGVEIIKAEAVNKSYPHFWEEWS